MSLVEIDWHPDRSALRRFGRTTLIGSLLIAAALYWLKGWPTAAAVVAAAGILIGGPALTGSRAALPGYRLWMGLAFVLGNVVSRLVLAGVYYLVVTPVGWCGRLVGRDRLGLRGPRQPSYWRDLPRDRAADHYERQF